MYTFYKTSTHFFVIHWFFVKYGGNPVSCSIANAVLDTIETENLRENALVVGEYLLDNCQLLAKKHEFIGDVRGMGLFVGIDVVEDKKTRNPDEKCAKYVLKRWINLKPLYYAFI